MSDLPQLLQRQRAFFRTGATLPVSYRLEALDRLRRAMEAMESRLLAALEQDLGKSADEGYMTEVGMVYSELSWWKSHLRATARTRRFPTPPAQFPAVSYQVPSPYGTVLVMSPWNYPLLLCLDPAIDAIAAGNTVVLKPSAYAPATSRVLAKLIASCLPPELCCVVEGGREVNCRLLEQRFDYIFFTGSKQVGRLVLEKAAVHLTPVTLELGGKSPCIVDESADLALAARRIVFGKFLNAGQTCVAPDYLLVHEGVHDRLLPLLQEEIVRQFGADPLSNPNYGRIVNRKHFDRLRAVLEGSPVSFGGRLDEDALRIAPAIIDHAPLDGPAMAEELFGPILPIVTWREWEQARAVIDAHPTPLALYLFTGDSAFREKVLSGVSFGGGCVNDTVIHLATSHMPFGGVGDSGMGSYHGKAGFDTFTHWKSVVDKKTWLDLPMRYQPYRQSMTRLIRFFLK